MKLSIAETARYLGKTDRQVRYAIQAGKLPATRVGGRWFVAKADLPVSPAMTEAQRTKRRRGTQIAAAPDGDRRDSGEGGRAYSVRMLAAYAHGAPIYRELATCLGDDHPAVRELREALQALSGGYHAFDGTVKADFYRTARVRASHAVMSLLLDDPEAHADAVDRLEQTVLPRIGGLIRRAERRGRGKASS
ncbi:MAG: helix-turn-helix domain-containing protein [Acidobacteriota bacterium]